MTAALIVAAAGPARGASLTVEGGPVVLGRTASAPVVIELDERPGAEDVPLRLSVNVGRFSDPLRVGPGRYRAEYVPPATRFPQVALVAAWRASGPDADLQFLRIPLLGITRVPVTARPGARVRVRVGAETFGPVTADRRGRVEVAVQVPPGVTRCEVRVTERRGRETAREVPVEVPPYNRLTAALVPDTVPAGARAEARLEVFYDAGPEAPPDAIRVVPSAGTASLVRASRGLYTFRVAPPAAAAAGPVAYEVSVSGDPTARAGAELALTAPRPERLVVTPPARPLRAGGGASATVDVLVLDAGGAGVPGLEVSATANGEPLPPPSSLGDGRYALRVTAPPTVPPGGALVIEAVAHHPDAFAFGTARCEIEAPPPAPLPLPPPPPVIAAPPPAPAPALAAAHRDRGRTVVAPACPVADERPRGASDGSAAFDRSFTAPSRRERGRVLAGLSAGYTRSPGVASGLRAGWEVWAPFQVGGARLGAGVSAGLGGATRTVSDATGTLRSTTEATFVPVALKLGVEAWATRRLAVTGGAGPLLAWARFRSSLATGTEQGIAIGWSGFVDLEWPAGPGAFVLGLSYGSAAVTTADYRVDPAGLSLAAGYRVKVL